MKKQKPIKPEAIAKMREIMVGSLLGRLRHNQSVYHCGTAHCVAGWNTVLNHADRYKEYWKEYGKPSGEWSMNDFQIAKADWGLNYREASFMFGGEASRAEQIGLIEFLADGHRLESSESMDVNEHGTTLVGKSRTLLMEYAKRFRGDREKRIEWAKKHDTRELVEELIACDAKPKEKPVVKQQEILKEVITVNAR